MSVCPFFVLSRYSTVKGYSSTIVITEVVNDLNFTDDIALLENAFEHAQAQLNTVAEEAMKIGLVINTQKTEFMTNTSCKKNLALNNTDIKLVDDFIYLGSMMSSSESDIKRRP